jgi:glutamyl-Q tRNA(Asp) synthetase
VHLPGCGRFAPSPTGDLHFGSLTTALASFLQARAQGARWLVRIEDLDRAREVPDVAARILHTLERLGLCWDGEVAYQSQRLPLYQTALAELTRQKLLYACTCSRRQLRAQQTDMTELIYPGTCRHQNWPMDRGAVRVRVPTGYVDFEDLLHGRQVQDLVDQVGDFLLRRADGVIAYQLAVVVDDAAQGITEVVRGCDLLASTPRQIFLQRCLGLPTPRYLHAPLAVQPGTGKLSKHLRAQAVRAHPPIQVLIAALRFLGQALPEGAADASPAELLRHVAAHWRIEAIPRVQAQPAPAAFAASTLG